jgi:hypothetical protein
VPCLVHWVHSAGFNSPAALAIAPAVAAPQRYEKSARLADAASPAAAAAGKDAAAPAAPKAALADKENVRSTRRAA